jgi:proteasome accessory factor BC
VARFRGDAEQARERQIALLLLLQSASASAPLTQDEIIANLEIDEYPVSASGPRRVKAYQGEPDAIRQKFERDKAEIRAQGFEILTVKNSDDREAYFSERSSGYAPAISFEPAEERVVRMAVAFCGLGPSGVFSAFNDAPARTGGLAASSYYGPVLRAIHVHRPIRFTYQSGTKKEREVDPLSVNVFAGAPYLVARVRGTDQLKGFRFSRMTSMPVLLEGSFQVNDDLLADARAWRPRYQKVPTPIDVVIETNENYATLLSRQYPHALEAKKKDGRVEVGVSFESPNEALFFVLDAGDRVRLLSPSTLKSDLKSWLKAVNRIEPLDVSGAKFDSPGRQGILGQTLQLLQAVHLSTEGLRISELSRRFDLDPNLVRYIMDRLTVMQPALALTGNPMDFPAHVNKECNDWDDPDDDSLYFADFSDPEGIFATSLLRWDNIFEINIALREASRIYNDPALFSAIEKLEAAALAHVHVETVTNEPVLDDVRRAIENHQLMKIEYMGAGDATAHFSYVEPSDVQVLNGHAMMRAYSHDHRQWRTYRVDRIVAIVAVSPAEGGRVPDPDPYWLTSVSSEGSEVTIVVRPEGRWLFETIPGARWAVVGDRFAVRFRVSEDRFLDQLMVRAGSMAYVAEGTERQARAGQDLASAVLETL